jgi:hypothetical protein
MLNALEHTMNVIIWNWVRRVYDDNVELMKLVSYQDIARFFSIPVSDVKDIFGVHPVFGNNIMKKELLKYLLAGSNMELNHVETLAAKWETARKSRTRNTVSESQRQRILKRDKNRCRYCGKRLTKSNRVIDHVVPWSRGGRNEDSNLVLACRDCNYIKGDKTLEEANMVLLPVPE